MERLKLSLLLLVVILQCLIILLIWGNDTEKQQDVQCNPARNELDPSVTALLKSLDANATEVLELQRIIELKLFEIEEYQQHDQNLVLSNQRAITDNQGTILKNQRLITTGQKQTWDNQQKITTNQGDLLQGQRLIQVFCE